MLDPRDIKYYTLAVGSSNIKHSTSTDIATRCPHCSGDDQWKHTKRLHLYVKNDITQVSCFTGDCPVKNKTVYSFLRDFYPNLLDAYKRETFKGNMETLTNRTQNSGSTDVYANFKKNDQVQDEPKEELLTESVEHNPVNCFDLSEYFDELDNRVDGQEYVKGRGFDFNLLQEKFGKMYVGKMALEINDKNYMLKDNIIIPLYANTGVMYGFYSRNIHEKEFFTFNPDNNIGYKVWNWFNIDRTQDVYIFEGIFDAISFAVSSGNWNVIATMGAQLNLDRLKELISPIFVLDNDISGFRNGLQYVKLGAKVYIQPKSILYKDMNIIYQKGIDCGKLVSDNLYSGILAEIELKVRM